MVLHGLNKLRNAGTLYQFWYVLSPLFNYLKAHKSPTKSVMVIKYVFKYSTTFVRNIVHSNKNLVKFHLKRVQKQVCVVAAQLIANWDVLEKPSQYQVSQKCVQQFLSCYMWKDRQ
jgi:hypothetical protein